MTSQIPGVVDGALYAQPAQPAPVVTSGALLSSLQPPGLSTAEIQFIEPPTRAIVSPTAMRVAAADRDGVPYDYNPSQLRVVINPGSDGRGEIEMSADQYRREIAGAQAGYQAPAPNPVQAAVFPNPVQAAVFPDPAQTAMPAPTGGLEALVAALRLAATPAPAPQPAPVVTQPGYSRADECDMPFLTSPPSKPQQRVIFDLGPGGVHKKRYHHASVSGTLLSLYYDTRYDDEDFTPPSTAQASGEDTPIGVTVEALNTTYSCVVRPEMHTQLGCLRVIQLLVLEQRAAS